MATCFFGFIIFDLDRRSAEWFADLVIYGDFNMEKHTKRGKNKQPFEIEGGAASRKTRRNHPGGQNDEDQGIRYDPMVSTHRCQDGTNRRKPQRFHGVDLLAIFEHNF